MTDSKISDFFTPSRNSVKRQRSHSSPGSTERQTNMAGDKVGDLTQEELLSSLSVVIGKMLDDKLANLATKEDFNNLAKKVTKLEEENRALRDEIQSLKVKEDRVADKLVDLESRSRRNNLIFKGLKGSETTKDCKLLVSNFCSDVLGADGKMWVNRAHHLGSDKKTVIAHLPYDCDIDYIMKRTHLLRGTGVVVHRDFPKEIREKRAALMSVRREVERVAGGRKMPLVHDHLVIEGVRFTWQGGKLMAGRQDGGHRLQGLLGHDFSSFLDNLGLGQSLQHGPRAYVQSAAATMNNFGGRGDDGRRGDNRGDGGGSGGGSGRGTVNQNSRPSNTR